MALKLLFIQLTDSLRHTSWLQATLPISLCGLGLRLASTSAPTAYIGSLNSTNVLVSLLLDLDTCTHFNLPENDLSLRTNLKASFPDMDINSASQKSLQRAIDTDTLLNCLESASLRVKERLYTIGTPFTGAWLLAIPNPNLGLTLSVCGLVVIFFPVPPPHSVRCVCGNIIDHIGDHVLGCGHCPLRIKRHDALSDIIWHNLLQDNKGAIKEQ